MQRPAPVAAGQTAFTTSGTTGEPVTWWRTGRQLTAEGELLCRLTAANEADLLVTYAPEQHLYGHLLTSVVPALAGLPVHRARLGEPLPRRCTRPLIAAVPATWWALARSAETLDAYASVTVVHSTAWLPDDARLVRDRHPRMTVLELHGSTETGLVGVRRSGKGPFRLADDVTFAGPAPADGAAGREGTERLTVSSPRLAARARGHRPPQRHTLDDVVERAGPRDYRLTGRRTRLLKINGVRVDLDGVEHTLGAAVPGARPVCVIRRDALRGEWYDVVVDGDEATVQAVARAARDRLRPAAAPRGVRRAAPASAARPSLSGRRTL